MGDNIARAQFIVPLQFNYNQQIKIIYHTLRIYFAFKYFLAFWGLTILYNLLKPFFIIFAKNKKALQLDYQRAWN